MSNIVPRVVTKQIGLARVDAIDAIELNRYLNDLERRLAALIPPVIQTELDALQAEVDTDEANLAAHIVDTTTHGTTTAIVGVSDTQGLANKTLDATNKFGGATNHTKFETDGTMVSVADARTYDDSQAAVVYMRTGGTALTLAAFDGGIFQYRLDVTDEVHSQIQLSHRYEPGTPIYLHVHLANKSAVGATQYNVGIEIEYMWGSINSVIPAAAVLTTIDCSFQNAAGLTHKVFEIATLTPSANQGSISSILMFRVKRVNGTTQNHADANIFLLGIDVHTHQDTLGSRQEYIK